MTTKTTYSNRGLSVNAVYGGSVSWNYSVFPGEGATGQCRRPAPAFPAPAIRRRSFPADILVTRLSGGRQRQRLKDPLSTSKHRRHQRLSHCHGLSDRQKPPLYSGSATFPSLSDAEGFVPAVIGDTEEQESSCRRRETTKKKRGGNDGIRPEKKLGGRGPRPELRSSFLVRARRIFPLSFGGFPLTAVPVD